MHRHLLVTVFGVALISLLLPAGLHARELSDSTFIESWRLDNGMEVRVRDIPGATGCSISLAYGAGTLDLPADRAGLARLLAELQFTAAAGDIPDRTRDEFDSLRPSGWDLRVTEHLAVLTEVATRQQFAGVLMQVATRARGVQLGDSCLRTALGTVRRQLADETLGSPDLVLHYRVRDIALGLDGATIIANARGRGLEGLSRQEASELLARLYVPANCALALVGDFSGKPMRALIDQLFGSIPGGSPAAERPAPPLVANVRGIALPGLHAPVSVIAAFAPSLDDTLHPACYLASLIAAGWWRDHAGKPRPPLGSSFRYSPVDEPDLVRFFLSSSPSASTPEAVQRAWVDAMGALRSDAVYEDAIVSARTSVDWLIGGPLPRAILAMSRKQLGPLTALSIGTAMRARWRGDAFWEAYRARFVAIRTEPNNMLEWLADPGHSAILTLTPRP